VKETTALIGLAQGGGDYTCPEPDITTSHSTKLPAEELLAGHPKDGNQVAGYVEEAE